MNPSEAPTHVVPGYRNTSLERARLADLIALLPKRLNSVLDVGARDGHLTRELVKYCNFVTALDLELPVIEHPKIACIKGDATAMSFADGTFDLVFCTEVLEHIPTPDLERACCEMSRVAGKYIVIGVPYKQDTRVGRLTCQMCGGKNPPWGHVNEFDERRLRELFPDLSLLKTTFVGEAEMGTNFVSAFLMDLAGNPYGTYEQAEPCIHCGAKMQRAPSRSLGQRLATKAAHVLIKLQALNYRPHGNWIHALFEKPF